MCMHVAVLYHIQAASRLQVYAAFEVCDAFHHA